MLLVLQAYTVSVALFKWPHDIYIYIVPSIGFQTFVGDSWEFSMLLLYILWDDWPIFMISASNEQLQQELEYTLLKPNCHNWWISKMLSDTLEERYAIKFYHKLGKMPEKHTECFRLLLEHREDVGTVQQVHCSRRRLLLRGLEFHVCTFNKSAHTKKVWKLI